MIIDKKTTATEIFYFHHWKDSKTSTLSGVYSNADKELSVELSILGLSRVQHKRTILTLQNYGVLVRQSCDHTLWTSLSDCTVRKIQCLCVCMCVRSEERQRLRDEWSRESDREGRRLVYPSRCRRHCGDRSHRTRPLTGCWWGDQTRCTPGNGSHSSDKRLTCQRLFIYTNYKNNLYIYNGGQFIQLCPKTCILQKKNLFSSIF